MYDAAVRAKKLRVDPVDRCSDDERGTFVMSLSIGDIIYMRDKETNKPGYFVVAKLDSATGRAFLSSHWDARRSVGEKDEEGNLIVDSKRRTEPYPPSKMQQLAPPGFDTPVKMMVSPLGEARPVEPHTLVTPNLDELDPEIVAIAREALTARKSKEIDRKKGRRLHGSWSWMRERLKKAGKEHLASELSAAMRMLNS